MRVDAKALLDRLGKQEFAYKEFADRFSELELWPLFEALLKDPRMASLDEIAEGANPEAAEAAFAVAAPAAPSPAVLAPAVATPTEAAASVAPVLSAAQTEAFSSLFARYENPEAAAPAPAPEPQRAKQDVRAMLRELSQLNQNGKL